MKAILPVILCNNSVEDKTSIAKNLSISPFVKMQDGKSLFFKSIEFLHENNFLPPIIITDESFQNYCTEEARFFSSMVFLKGALSNIASLVLASKIAKKLFGEEIEIIAFRPNKLILNQSLFLNSFYEARSCLQNIISFSMLDGGRKESKFFDAFYFNLSFILKEFAIEMEKINLQNEGRIFHFNSTAFPFFKTREEIFTIREIIAPVCDVVFEFTNTLKEEVLEINGSNVVSKPWGYYEILLNGANHKVKKLFIKPFSSISLQTHFRRSEHWVVVNGIASIVYQDGNFLLKAGEAIFIPSNTKHRISNETEIPLEVIETQVGEYLEEDDIVRYEDIYGRA